MSLAVACVAFAAIYYLIDAVFHAPYRRGLGLAHLTLAVLGTALIFTPTIALRVFDAPDANKDATGTFAVLHAASSLGYVMTLVGVVVFAVLLIDAVRRRPIRGASATPHDAG